MKHLYRIENLQARIKEEDLSGALLFYSRDVFYYAGTAQPSYLVVLPNDYFLFVRSGFESALNEACIEKDNIKEERRLDAIYKKIFSKLAKGNKLIGTELDVLPSEKFFEFKKIFVDYDFLNISPFILEQRKTKDASEIEKMKEACKVIDLGHKAVLSNLKEGISELELAVTVENAHRLGGHEGAYFVRQPDFFMSRGPISSGPNLFKNSGVVYSITGVGLSPSVPVGPSRRKIGKRDLVVVDIPVLVNGYHADQTRTYSVGKASNEIKLLYGNLKEIVDYLIDNIEIGMKCSDIFKMAMEKARNLKSFDYFQSFGKGKKSHFIGHGVGLELNEPPIISANDHSKISDGYVIALDTHMLKENVGVVKLEDMILINSKGNEILNRSPRHLFEV